VEHGIQRALPIVRVRESVLLTMAQGTTKTAWRATSDTDNFIHKALAHLLLKVDYIDYF
jgi:hypothetical protein